MSEHDNVNHPKHYTNHPSGVECIDIVEHMGFNLGNAIKYIWRADLKDNCFEDLKKAAWYLNREIEKRTKDSYRNADRQFVSEEEAKAMWEKLGKRNG